MVAGKVLYIGIYQSDTAPFRPPYNVVTRMNALGINTTYGGAYGGQYPIINDALLAPYNIFVVSGLQHHVLSSAEISSIVSWVQHGNMLIVGGDTDYGNPAPHGLDFTSAFNFRWTGQISGVATMVPASGMSGDPFWTEFSSLTTAWDGTGFSGSGYQLLGTGAGYNLALKTTYNTGSGVVYAVPCDGLFYYFEQCPNPQVFFRSTSLSARLSEKFTVRNRRSVDLHSSFFRGKQSLKNLPSSFHIEKPSQPYQRVAVRVYKGGTSESPTYIDYPLTTGVVLNEGDQVVLVHQNGNANAPMFAGRLSTTNKATVTTPRQRLTNVPCVEGLGATPGDNLLVAYINGDPNKPVALSNVDTSKHVTVGTQRLNVRAYPPKSGIAINSQAPVVYVGDPVIINPVAPVLYAGTSIPGNVWRYNNGTSWQRLGPAEGIEPSGAIFAIVQYHGVLYAGGAYGTYRYNNDFTWTMLTNDENQTHAFVIYQDKLYAARSKTLWRLDGGTTWTPVFTASSFLGVIGAVSTSTLFPNWINLADYSRERFGRSVNEGWVYDGTYNSSYGVNDLKVYNNKLYAACYQKLRYSTNGINFDSVVTNTDVYWIYTLGVLNNKLYLGATQGNSEAPSLGKLLSYDGSSFVTITSNVEAIISMAIAGNTLYFGTGYRYHENYTTGTYVYAYQGTGVPTRISNTNQFGAQGSHYTGIQCLYVSP